MTELVDSVLTQLRPRRTVLIVFAALWAVVAQYYLFLFLLPDGGLSAVRTVSNAVLSALMFPIGMLQTAFEPVLAYDRFPGYVSVPLLVAYFYLLAVLVASGYEYLLGS